MARRTIDKPTEEQAEQLPLLLPETRRRREPARLFALAFLALLAVTGAYFMFLWDPPQREASRVPGASDRRGTQAPVTSATPGPPALSFDALASLPQEQQKVEVEKMLRRYFERARVAGRTLDPAPYYEVTTGQLLQERLRTVEEFRSQGHGTDGPPPDIAIRWFVVGKDVRAVGVAVEFTDRWWYVDVKTGQRIGDEKAAQVAQTYTFVEEAGQWKVKAIADAE